MRLTRHALQRGKERLGLRDEAIERLAERALNEGLRTSDTSGRFRRYLDKLFLSHGKAGNLRVYGEKIYLFNGSLLITIFHLPNEYKKAAAKLRTRQQEALERIVPCAENQIPSPENETA